MTPPAGVEAMAARTLWPGDTMTEQDAAVCARAWPEMEDRRRASAGKSARAVAVRRCPGVRLGRVLLAGRTVYAD
jgi:hypothetical protein